MNLEKESCLNRVRRGSEKELMWCCDTYDYDFGKGEEGDF